uniref:Zinc finger PHD-type domain-containing protein n=1 Tax=Magallana gigas TaxID=29159 RepID=K1Q4K7_MAGGI
MVVEDMQVLAPKKKRGPSRKLDDFDEDLVKRTIHDMQLKGQYVSLRRLSDVLVERGVRITKTPLGRLVKDLGFKFYKAGSNRRYIGERNDIESDDEVTCCICGDYNAPGKSQKIVWVECEVCKRWSHRICTKPSLKSGKCVQCWNALYGLNTVPS